MSSTRTPGDLWGEPAPGFRPAWLCAVVPWAPILVFLILASMGVAVASRRARRASQHTAVINSLKQVGISLSLYESRFKAYPQDSQDLAKYLREVNPADPESTLRCPVCGGTFELIKQPEATGPGCGPGVPQNGVFPDVPFARHACPAFDGEVFVLFFQGRVDVFAAGSPLAQEFLKPGRPDPAHK